MGSSAMPPDSVSPEITTAPHFEARTLRPGAVKNQAKFNFFRIAEDILLIFLNILIYIEAALNRSYIHTVCFQKDERRHFPMPILKAVHNTGMYILGYKTYETKKSSVRNSKNLTSILKSKNHRKQAGVSKECRTSLDLGICNFDYFLPARQAFKDDMYIHTYIHTYKCHFSYISNAWIKHVMEMEGNFLRLCKN
jgi:hypothetical protein